MKTINENEIVEISRWDCPYCNAENEICFLIMAKEILECRCCGKKTKVKVVKKQK